MNPIAIVQKVKWNNAAFDPPMSGIWYRFTDDERFAGEIMFCHRKEGDFIIDLSKGEHNIWEVEFHKHIPNRTSFTINGKCGFDNVILIGGWNALGEKPISEIENETMAIFNKFKDQLKSTKEE